MRSIDQSFYKSKTWGQCRAAYAKAFPLCEECLKRGIIKPVEIVHHKIELNADNVNDPAIAYGFDNLESVCRDCHNKIHFADTTVEKRWEFNDKGELIVKE